MGNPESKDQAVRDELEAMQRLTDEQKTLADEEISKDMNSFYEQLKKVPSLFPPHEVSVLKMEGLDIHILRYSHLQSTDEICENVKQNLKEFPGDDMVIDNMQRVLRSAKSSKEIQHSDSNKMVEVVNGMSIGIEVHYKIKVVQEDKWGFSLSSKDNLIKKNALVVVGYKYATHALNVEASKVPPTEDM